MKSLLGLGAVLLAAATVLLFGLSHIAAPANHARAPAPRPVLVETFTSQGCPSCPPANRLLARLAAAGEVLALSRPVTSWAELGWPDTLDRGGHARLTCEHPAPDRHGGGTTHTQGRGAGRA